MTAMHQQRPTANNCWTIQHQWRSSHTLSETLFKMMFCRSQWTDSGLRSLAKTWQPFLAAGTANGPTPANTSYSTALCARDFTIRWRSVPRQQNITTTNDLKTHWPASFIPSFQLRAPSSLLHNVSRYSRLFIFLECRLLYIISEMSERRSYKWCFIQDTQYQGMTNAWRRDSLSGLRKPSGNN